jgi:hypothetical protein
MGRPRRKGGGADTKGRSIGTDRFVRLGHNLLSSNAYRALTPNARSLLVELAMLDNGGNNGSLYLSVRDAAARIGIVDLRATSRAFDELMALGFIELAQESHFQVKASETSRARCWRLTWLPGPGRKAPTPDFLTREPAPQTKARKRMESGLRALKAYRKAKDQGKMPVVESGTLAAIRPEMVAVTVAESDTQNHGNGRIAPIGCIRDSATHTAIPGGREPPTVSLAWWQPDWTPAVANLAYLSSMTANRWRLAA